jgi:antitoxin component YwqK of YwqJK toxin-antitoxin module
VPDAPHPDGRPPDGLHVERHSTGSLRARGPVVDGQPHGYWEWFRLDGSLMRSGTFDHGRTVGTWTSYDRDGSPYKVTEKGPAQPSRP